MKNKQLTLSLLFLTIANAGCQSTSINTRFIGEPITHTSESERKVGVANVLYEFDGTPSENSYQSILEYPNDITHAESVKQIYNVHDADEDIVTPVKPKIALDNKVSSSSTLIAKSPEKSDANTVPKDIFTLVKTKVAPDNKASSSSTLIEKSPEKARKTKFKSSLDENKAVTVPKENIVESTQAHKEVLFQTLTPEDRIMSSDINGLEYQYPVEFKALTLVKTTENVSVSLDEEAAKAHLINQYYNTDTNYENDREVIERPKGLVVFKGVIGTLNENIHLLFEATGGVNAISDVSDNHKFEYEFTIEGETALKVFDKMIDAFKSPNPIKAKAYSINKVVHIEYSR